LRSKFIQCSLSRSGCVNKGIDVLYNFCLKRSLTNLVFGQGQAGGPRISCSIKFCLHRYWHEGADVRKSQSDHHPRVSTAAPARPRAFDASDASLQRSSLRAIAVVFVPSRARLLSTRIHLRPRRHFVTQLHANHFPRLPKSLQNGCRRQGHAQDTEPFVKSEASLARRE
jgi:hypothetical protein